MKTPDFYEYQIADAMMPALLYGDYDALDEHDFFMLKQFEEDLPTPGHWEWSDETSLDLDDITGTLGLCVSAKYHFEREDAER